MKKEREIIREILSGMFIASTNNSACVVDTVLQVSNTEKPMISVCINKNNYTNEMIKKNKKFAISILGMQTEGKIIETFGFHSSRDLDKFKDFSYIEKEEIKILKDSLGYMLCNVVQIVDTKTHDIFIGEVFESERLNAGLPMSYQYYCEHKEDLVKVKTETGKTAWVCMICGYVYYGEELPDDFICPKCGYRKEAFKRKNSAN